MVTDDALRCFLYITSGGVGMLWKLDLGADIGGDRTFTPR